MTGMFIQQYPISTRVTIDGVDAYTSGPDMQAGHPILLDGMSLQWGRQTNVDQPDVGTCTLSIRQQLNAPGAQVGSMLDIIHTGSNVAVWAKAAVPAADGETMSATNFMQTGTLDPTLWTSIAGTCAVTVSKFQQRYAAWVTGSSSTIVFAPQPFQPVGQSPDAWDLIPRLVPGASWTITITAWCPPGAGGHLAAYAFTAPNTGTGPQACTVVDNLGHSVTLIGDGVWHTYTGTVTLPSGYAADGAWITPGVVLSPLPSGLTVAQMSGRIIDQPYTFDDYGRIGVASVSLVSTGPTVRDVLVWSGQVTSAVSKSVGPWAFELDVTASDTAAALSNETVTDDAWSAQTLQARITHIQSLATGMSAVSIDPTLDSFVLTYRDDIQAQQVFPLLQDVADSVGGVMWAASHATSGQYLWLEDPRNRVPLRRFIVDSTSGQVTIGGNDRDVSVISGGDMLLDPAQWGQDVAQAITSVDVNWQQQGVDTDGTTPTATSQTVTVTADAATVTKYGLRKLSVDTELTTAADATDLANRWLTQAANTGWVVSGLTLDSQLIQTSRDLSDYSTRLSTLMDLLDGTRRLGRGLVLVDLPVWTPSGRTASVYLEGGTYTLSNGRWQLQMLASPANSGGQLSTAPVSSFPTGVKISDFATGISFDDATGVAAPVAA